MIFFIEDDFFCIFVKNSCLSTKFFSYLALYILRALLLFINKICIMKKLIFFAIVSYLLFTSCTQHCADFNADILSWMPYKMNDTISLKKNNQIIKFVVSNTFIHHTAKYNKSSLRKCGECNNYFGLYAGDANKHIYYESLDDQDITQIRFEIRDNGMPININSTFKNRTPLSSITIDSFTYQDVLVLWEDTIMPNNFWKVVLVKNKGLVAAYYGDSIMTVQKNMDRTTSVEDYNLTNVNNCK